MRITESVVRRIADWAAEVSGGGVSLQAVGGDLGNGVRYIDGHKQLVWLGRTGAREAAAYYAFAGIEWATREGVAVPGWVCEYANTLSVASAHKVREACDQGRLDAEGEWKRDRCFNHGGYVGRPASDKCPGCVMSAPVS